jgi:hypothetical protein
MEDLPSSPPRTIIVAGMGAEDWGDVTSKEFASIDGAVRSGSRLVLALRADFADAKNTNPLGADNGDEDEDENRVLPEKAKPKKADAAPHHDTAVPHGARRGLEVGDGEKPEPTADLKRLWGIDLLKLGRVNYDKGAVLDPAAPRDLPQKLRWKSDSYFSVEPGASWRVIYRALGKPVVLETQYGRGSIVVMGDAYLLSNEGLLNDRSTHLLSWIIGPDARVEFDESHLGIMEEVGVAALARRYGLMYAAGTLLLVAALFIWRQTALFVPPPGEVSDAALDCSHTAALEALLLRSVPPADLIGACASEWRATAPSASLPRLEAVLGPNAGVRAPEAYNAAVRALRRK